VLLDKAPLDLIIKVEQILKSFPEIKTFHNLKVRAAGADTFVKVNIHLQPELSLPEVHEICDRIEAEIGKNITRCEVFVHPEPEN
jgi:divalent metal cation (Fe/Co/Zn/Cd) transporter